MTCSVHLAGSWVLSRSQRGLMFRFLESHRRNRALARKLAKVRSTVYGGNGIVSIGYDEAHAGGGGGGDVHLCGGNGVVDRLAVREAAGQAGGFPT